jgi:prepilin-type N-terminal cleavage/methylation domain-containing protein
MKKIREKGFTLVELLIVIALIAILSVGVLATINPVEQRNKATDATTANDAGEVLNAYERYYTNNSMYPWKTITPTLNANNAYGAVSNTIGFGLCGTTVSGAADTAACSSYTQPGSLISADELKDSFLQKGYGKAVGTGAGQTSFDRLLYVYKADAAGHNSIYVCFIPQAKSNRNKNNNLKALTFTNGVPSAIADAPASAFNPDGSTNVTFTDVASSLFKCVP